LYGEHGRNGKSKLLSLLEHFVGVPNTAAISLNDIENDQFAIVSLQNKLVNIASDISNDAIKHTGKYKKITGRDPVSANRKNKTRVQFVNYAKMIFTANELPPVYTLSNAFWLRWVVIEFPYQFLPENELNALAEKDKEIVFLQDQEILQKIETQEEREGLLVWALAGLKSLEERKYFANETTASHIQKYWLRKSNSVAAFIEDSITTDYDCDMTKTDFRKFYHTYCKKHNIAQASDAVIKITLQQTCGVSTHQEKSSGLRKWVGIRLKNLIEYKTCKIMKELKENPKGLTYNEVSNIFEDREEFDLIMSQLANSGDVFELPKNEWRLK